MEKDINERIIQTIIRFDVLTKLPRSGFLIRGIDKPETVGEHCFSSTVLAAILLDELREDGFEIDGEKLLKMAVLHESGEILVGDIPHPVVAILGSDVKAKLELEAGKRVLRSFPKLSETVEEFEEGKSIEARIVRSIDKLQMMIKVLIYESEKKGDLEDFWNYADNVRKIGIPKIDNLFDSLRSFRGKICLDYLEMLK